MNTLDLTTLDHVTGGAVLRTSTSSNAARTPGIRICGPR